MSQKTFAPLVPGLELLHQGKVRDTYAIPGHPNLLLVVATDRVSTHNIVHLSEIARKGYCLSELTCFWMSQFGNTHLVAHGEEIWDFLPTGTYPEDLPLRAIVVKRLNMIPVEFIFRSRMAGSLWKDYYSKGLQNPYGINLPAGLTLMSPFAQTIFTPTDKSETDEPINSLVAIARYPEAYRVALMTYEFGREQAAKKGIEIIDGKFEVGIDPETNEVVLADECLTPDSCRFVRAKDIVVGKEPPWMDKQFLREYAEQVWNGGKKYPIDFNPQITFKTGNIYEEIALSLMGN